MANTSVTLPGTAANDASVGSNDWVSVDNIKTDDTNYSECYFGFVLNSNYLKATNFGFAIPSGATINGIEVSINKWCNTSGLEDERVSIVKSDGSIGSTNKGDIGTSWSTSATVKKYGGSSDLWSETLSYTDINDSDFGIVLQADPSGAGQRARVNYIKITVYYTESSTGTNMQVNIGDTWKEVPAVQINIGDTWKEVVSIKQNIGDTWKEVF